MAGATGETRIRGFASPAFAGFAFLRSYFQPLGSAVNSGIYLVRPSRASLLSRLDRLFDGLAADIGDRTEALDLLFAFANRLFKELPGFAFEAMFLLEV
jgi:hypothetical protein